MTGAMSVKKILTWQIFEQFRPIVEHQINEQQCSFCPSLGIVDQLWSRYRGLKGLWEFPQSVLMWFVVVEKEAFDRIPRGNLWRVLWE